jgi:hypothetical protein
MQLREIIEDIRTKPTVPIWPHLGAALNLSRGAAYAAAKRGDIETIRIGKLVRAVSAPLRKRLGIEEVA